MRGKARVKDSSPCPGDVQDLTCTRFSPGDEGPKFWWATDADWSQRKALIKRLYLTENKPLWEVKDIMQTKYSFNATQSMYKKRLRSWGCSKYTRANARPAQYSLSWSPSGLVIKSPEIFHIPYTILLGIQDYVNERNDNENSPKSIEHQGAALPVKAHNHTTHARCRETLDAIFSNAKSSLDIETSSGSAADFINSVEASRELLAEHQLEEAFSELRRLPGKIEGLLRDEPHHVLNGIFFTIIKLNWDGNDSGPENGILKALLTYIASFAADSSLAWPRTYPLRRILDGLSRMENQSDLAEVTIKCWKYLLEMPKPLGDETDGGSCVISSFSVPRNFENMAETREEPDELSQDFVPAWERLGIHKRRTRYDLPRVIDPFPQHRYSSRGSSSLRIDGFTTLRTNTITSRIQISQREKEGSNRESTPTREKTAFKSQRYLGCAYEATGLKHCFKLYLDELVKEAVSRTRRTEDVRLVVLRMCRLEHLLSQWGDEENLRHVRRNLVLFGGAEYYDMWEGAEHDSVSCAPQLERT